MHRGAAWVSWERASRPPDAFIPLIRSELKKKREIYMGAAITTIFLVLSLIPGGFVERLELRFYDLRMNLAAPRGNYGKIVLVDIDDRSLEGMGRWPWSRSILAAGIRKIDAGRPKAIGLSVLLDLAEENPGLAEIGLLRERFAKMPGAGGGLMGQFGRALDAAEAKLDGDGDLARALNETGTVIIPVRMTQLGRPARRGTGRKLDSAHLATGVKLLDGPFAAGISLPIDRLLDEAMGVGHDNPDTGPDGVNRQERLLYGYRGAPVPSYSLRLAAAFLGVPPARIAAGSEGLRLGTLKVPVGGESEYYVGFRQSPGAFRRLAFLDVIEGRVAPSTFRNKLVLISPAAQRVAMALATPVNAAMDPGERTAHAVASILEEGGVLRPPWDPVLRSILILFSGILLVFVLPRLGTTGAAVFSTVFILLFGLLATWLFISSGLWIGVAFPVLQIAAGFAGLAGVRHLLRSPAKRESETAFENAHGAEKERKGQRTPEGSGDVHAGDGADGSGAADAAGLTDTVDSEGGVDAADRKATGILMHKRGKLDEAFDAFSKLPVDGEIKELLYALGRDYEGTGELERAVDVYDYIEEHDPLFRDVGSRKSGLLQMGETMVVGDDIGPPAPFGGAAGEVPSTLGRYEIVRQLGQGAMGIVYLGRDPRINRITAIKTIRFGESYGEKEAEDVKRSFFREAESAGTLSHPHIVTIYDAGEEEGLAYIAMEYLEGDALSEHVAGENLLPMRKVIDCMADLADALAYAHEKGIVHRDIKPANIMLLTSGAAKITDFGIARITASSQTRTGVVKGTPYYMSPEQITGQKVDGRTDIYSLGVMLYQLLTGEIPFSAESPAALMHKILYEPHPDPRSINPRIFKPLAAIIDRALAKEPEARYQDAGQMAVQLKRLSRLIEEAVAKKRAMARQGGQTP